MEEKKKLCIYGGLIIGMAVSVCLMLVPLCDYYRFWEDHTMSQYEEDKVRALNINDQLLDELYEKQSDSNYDMIQTITILMILHDYDLSEATSLKEIQGIAGNGYQEYIKELYELDLYRRLYHIYDMVFSDLVYFPIPVDLKNNQTVFYENSWLEARTYGGSRGHEGVDLMPSLEVRGYYPVLSLTDGVVEKKGWLDKGGYRVGIRSESGGYFYYAHLYSFADGLEEGDQVVAGQLLGFMGDTGYSPVEGTTGQFAIHLHFGIYVYEEKNEMSVNPYWVLKYLERKRLAYEF